MLGATTSLLCERCKSGSEVRQPGLWRSRWRVAFTRLVVWPPR